MKDRDHSIKKSSVITAVLVMMLVFGVGIILYPSLADLYNRAHASETIQGYDREMEKRSRKERETLWKEAQEYNQELAERTIRNGGTIDTGNITVEDDSAYQDALDIDDEGTMGYVSVPSVGIRLPIGHGIGEKVLQMEAGHLEGSSLPVGGASTHCVLTGHTGLPSARLFTPLDEVKEGDTFQLVVLNQTLTYEVFRIEVVLPTSADSLRIEEGQDLCTLLTCTPYGINDHRLLVTGRRIPNPEHDAGTAQETESIENKVVLQDILPAVIAAAALTAFIIFYTEGRRRKRRDKKHGS